MRREARGPKCPTSTLRPIMPVPPTMRLIAESVARLSVKVARLDALDLEMIHNNVRRAEANIIAIRDQNRTLFETLHEKCESCLHKVLLAEERLTNSAREAQQLKTTWEADVVKIKNDMGQIQQEQLKYSQVFSKHKREVKELCNEAQDVVSATSIGHDGLEKSVDQMKMDINEAFNLIRSFTCPQATTTLPTPPVNTCTLLHLPTATLPAATATLTGGQYSAHVRRTEFRNESTMSEYRKEQLLLLSRCRSRCRTASPGMMSVIMPGIVQMAQGIAGSRPRSLSVERHVVLKCGASAEDRGRQRTQF